MSQILLLAISGNFLAGKGLPTLVISENGIKITRFLIRGRNGGSEVNEVAQAASLSSLQHRSNGGDVGRGFKGRHDHQGRSMGGNPWQRA